MHSTIPARKVAALCLPLALAFATVVAGHAQTGKPNPSLTPPGAPADGIFKTLDQVEARTPINATNTPGNASAVHLISASGSYYLTENLVGQASKHGIQINANHVTIDLNGFEIEGVANSIDGISSPTSSTVHVTNGTVRDWGRHGIFSSSSFARNWIIDDVRLSGNASSGISVFSAAISDCAATGNGSAVGAGAAIEIRGRGSLISCLAINNASHGFLTASSSVTNCSASSNLKSGFIVTSGIVSDCISVANNEHGFSVGFSTLISGCQATGNGFTSNGAGILTPLSLGNRNRISGIHVSNNNRGIQVETAGNIITGNTSLGNTPDGGTTDTDYDIVSGNMVGTLVTLNSSSSAVAGNTGGGSTASDPYANFAD